MPKLLAVLALFMSCSVWAEERYMPNEADGFVVLTNEVCKDATALKQGYKWRAYATESSELALHEGCWDSPSTAGAPKLKDVTIIPLVNLWFDGDRATYPQSMFGPEKKRWDTDQVKPNV
jgi:hypothetical protein